MKINIYYQDIFYGKEIADSLSRYLFYCLEENRTVKTEISINSYKLLENEDDYHVLCFQDLIDDIAHWGSLIGKLEKKVEDKKWKLRIIDLTLQNEFPIKTTPDHVVITASGHGLDWLSRLTIVAEAEEMTIEASPDYLRTYYAAIEHR